MDPVCRKLQDFLQCGYVSREHIFYKLIKNAVDFVTAVNNDFSKENQFEWDSEILEVFRVAAIRLNGQIRALITYSYF